MNVDDGLEDILRIRGLGGERSCPRRRTLFTQTRRKKVFVFVICFPHTNDHFCYYQTPGRRPPCITGRRVNTVTREWVGALDERAPIRFHDAIVVLSIDVCQDSESRRFESNNIAEFFSGRLFAPTFAQDFFSFKFFFKFFFFSCFFLLLL